MNDVKGILEVLCRSSEIAEKFFAIETSILSIHNFRDLFDKLLTEVTTGSPSPESGSP